MQTLGTTGDLGDADEMPGWMEGCPSWGRMARRWITQEKKMACNKKERGEEVGFESSYVEMRCWLLGIDKSTGCQRITGFVCVHSR